MTLLGIHNIFHQIAVLMQPDIKHYHFGPASEVNYNAPNFPFNPGNSVGKQYPAVLFIPPDGKWAIKGRTDNAQSFMDVTLMFYDLQHYTNKGANDKRSNAQVLDNLLSLAQAFLLYIKEAGRKKGLADKVSIVGEPKFQTMLYTHQDRVVKIMLDFTLEFKSGCIIPLDYDDLSASYPFPPSLTDDYELIPES